MPIVLELRFPWGRYHATPWGRAVNEATPEWPPSPWRLLRALYATWRWRLPELGAPVVEGLLADLATPPSFLLPRYGEAHTRHYYPDIRDGKDKVFDTFVAMDRGAAILVRWERETTGERRGALAALCTQLSYLGRAESICQARLVEAEAGAGRGRAWSAPTEISDHLRPANGILVAEEPLDLDALTQTTVAIRSSGRRYPRGSRLVDYALPSREIPSTAAPRRSRAPARPTVAWLALEGPVLPSVGETVLVADLARKAALSCHGTTSPTLAGKDESGTPLQGHRHAHYLPRTRAGSRLLDSVAIWAPMGLTPREVEALARIRHLFGGRPDLDFVEVRVALESLGDESNLLRELGASSPARTWRSSTPFAPYRHRKARQSEAEFLTEEVARELGARGLPQECRVTKVAPEHEGWLSYRRQRPNKGPDLPVVGLELSFEEPVRGPIALGALSHFGLGLFLPVDGS